MNKKARRISRGAAEYAEREKQGLSRIFPLRASASPRETRPLLHPAFAGEL